MSDLQNYVVERRVMDGVVVVQIDEKDGEDPYWMGVVENSEDPKSEWDFTGRPQSTPEKAKARFLSDRRASATQIKKATMSNIHREHAAELVKIAKRIASSNPRLSRQLNAAALKMAVNNMVTIQNYVGMITEDLENEDESAALKHVKELAATVGNSHSASTKTGGAPSLDREWKASMKPSQLAGQLRRIAGGIDVSKNPSKTKVIVALRSLIASVSIDDVIMRIEDACDSVFENGQLLPTFSPDETPTHRIEVQGLPLSIDVSTDDPESDSNTYILNWTGPEKEVAGLVVGSPETSGDVYTIGVFEDPSELKSILTKTKSGGSIMDALLKRGF